MYRAIPTSSKILTKKWESYNQSKHIQNLRKIKGLISQAQPRKFKHLQEKAKRG